MNLNDFQMAMMKQMPSAYVLPDTEEFNPNIEMVAMALSAMSGSAEAASKALLEKNYTQVDYWLKINLSTFIAALNMLGIELEDMAVDTLAIVSDKTGRVARDAKAA